MAGSAHARMPLPSPHQPTRGERVDADASRHQHSTTTTLAEAIETTRIHRVAGLTGDRTALVTTRPCRAPHQTISDAGLIGGGHVPMPGEVSLAHHGVLFLDELPECRRHVLEVLRQPLEEGVV
jgi:magnesium chelatase family protein